MATHVLLFAAREGRVDDGCGPVRPEYLAPRQQIERTCRTGGASIIIVQIESISTRHGQGFCNPVRPTRSVRCAGDECSRSVLGGINTKT